MTDQTYQIELTNKAHPARNYKGIQNAPDLETMETLIEEHLWPLRDNDQIVIQDADGTILSVFRDLKWEHAANDI